MVDCRRGNLFTSKIRFRFEHALSVTERASCLEQTLRMSDSLRAQANTGTG